MLRAALEALFAAGARQAGPGEFTKRAFLNGRLDLTEAEAVIDIIEAGTAEAAVNAAGQLGGALSRRAEAVYSDVVDIISHFDAVLDYPDEDIEPFELRAYAERLDAGAAELRRLLASFERGRVLREGLPAAIIGRTPGLCGCGGRGACARGLRRLAAAFGGRRRDAGSGARREEGRLRPQQGRPTAGAGRRGIFRL